MIVRQFCARQSRLLALRQPRILARCSSTETPVSTDIQVRDGVEYQGIPSNQGLASEEEKESARTAWKQLERQKNQFDTFGTVAKDVYDPDAVVKNPPRATDVTLEMLLASQTHLGHTTSRWNPQNSRYIFGIRDGIHIISLDQTAAYLRRAAKIVEEVAARGGLIVFAGTRRGQKDAIVGAAELAKSYHVFERWVPGSLTNSQQILGHCEKRVVNGLDEELPQFGKYLNDRRPLRPDLVVCLNPIENTALLRECALNTVPTIGIVDTDADPTSVTYQIPANDDSLRSAALVAGVLGRAGEEGQKRRLARAKQGRFTYSPVNPEDLLKNPYTGERE